MRTLLGKASIQVPLDSFTEYVTDKVQSEGNISYSEEIEINEITLDKENQFIYLSIDMYKRMDA
ncbi:hypothetical protein SmphiM6_48 [Sinorhizobium phage phiM6]|nr:hypothetical protein SmphiM6_48 [Sinorhizobium phage phiM6]